MKVLCLIQKLAIPMLFLLFFLPASSRAQYISLKSIPVASGDQFMIYPSQNLGMGGVSIALNDPLLDPFVNPAKGVRVTGVRLLGSPTFYNISDNNGVARTLPLGALFGAEKWFGGFSVAVQQLGAPELPNVIWFRTVDFMPGRDFSQTSLSDKNANNFYLSGLLGTKLGDSDISVAAGVSWFDLEAVDGVELLYANSLNIEQFGHMVDYRIGLFGELSGDRSFEVLLLHNRFNMTHDVTYPYWFFDEETNTTTNGLEVERNLERTNTWGLHLGYVQPLSRDEWRIGAIFTTNRKSHPKIPNYELMNIPRDPGDSWAFNIGTGISRTNGPATFGMDLIFEPIWSTTWAEARERIKTPDGRIIRAGDKTVNNDFKFTNWLLRFGIGRQESVFGFQLGLQVRWFRYRLVQDNKVEASQRTQKESWAEWTPSVGLSLNFPEFQIRYTGRLTSGTGRPGVARNSVQIEDGLRAGDLIAAPSGELTLQDAQVFTHQLSVSIPLRH
ncbi:MAG: hypothetical protein ACE5G1_15345 [bacterium]